MELPLSNRFKHPGRWLIGATAAILLGTAAVAGITSRRSNSRVSLDELTVAVEPADVTVRIEATGEVQPVQRVNLSPKTQGRLERLYVEQGDEVSQGEIVAEMENQELLSQLDQAQARLERARARLEEAETGARPEEIDRARGAVRQAEARLAGAQANLAQLRAGNRPEDIAEAEAAVNRAQSTIREAESRLMLAQGELRRHEQLYQDGAISRQELDRREDELRRAQAAVEQAQSARVEAQRREERIRGGSRREEVERAEAEVASAETDVSQAQSQLDELLRGTRRETIAQARADVMEAEAQVRFAGIQLEDTRVRAPFSGIITQRYADEGAFVTPATSASTVSSATSTSVVALARGLEVLAKVPEADINQIQAGQVVEIVADAFPDEVFQGEVRLIAPEAIVERDVTLFQVRLDIVTGLEQLRSGMNVDLTFLGDRLPNALVLPTVAIVTRQGEAGVLVPDEEGRPQFQSVTLGPTLGNRIQVLAGLEDGDRVFLELPRGENLDEILQRHES
ncbi:efflux RND transporter periplasmic adaptor subunit [Phormidium yuhuli AB48]|uniref:Efflux RND transporter periplasmic adaptor subunit n=1 Tax=Phormidium yuhuli AB48 TaxID=2940671 RepID=A0ABY5AS50_9CYAN|nr:efflux RND transporter periplasmic adaptor subunit [Phormidium yuhuli]USR92044.1 efflux RND transporter periplasmic adaptor subunit [Phormidium yuhuli AB48]